MSITLFCQPYVGWQQYKSILSYMFHISRNWMITISPLGSQLPYLRLNHIILRKFCDVNSMGFALGEKWVLPKLWWEHMVLVIFKIYKHISWKKKKKTEISRILFESSKSMNLQCLIGQILWMIQCISQVFDSRGFWSIRSVVFASKLKRHIR